MSHADAAVVVELGGFVSRAVLAGALLAQAEVWSCESRRCADACAADCWRGFASLAVRVREAVWIEGSFDACGPLTLRSSDERMVVCAALRAQADVWVSAAARSADAGAIARVWTEFAFVARGLAHAISLQFENGAVVPVTCPAPRRMRRRVVTRSGIVVVDAAGCPVVTELALVVGDRDA